MSDNRSVHQSNYRGWLYKWTNYLRGYQKRWFVLQNGLLSYYRNQAEMAHTCRGTINLANAYIHTEDANTIVISNSGTHTFYLKATSEVERQKWVTALELAKADAIKLSDPGDSDEEVEPEPNKNELQNMVKTLTAKLEDMNTCNDLIAKHGTGLQRALTEVESMDSPSEAGSKLKVINERATMFRITTNAMINACGEYLDVAQTQVKRLQKIVNYEHEQRMKLEEMVEQLAKEQVTLETKAKQSMGHGLAKKGPPGSDEEDFFDALDYQAEEFEVALPHNQPKHRRTDSNISFDSQADERSSDLSSEAEESEGQEARVYSHKSKQGSPKQATASVKSQLKRNANSDSKRNGETQLVAAKAPRVPSGGRVRRAVIPPKPNYSLNLWSIMKNCIGKDLSKIPMPVNFSEPLSMLQRLTEEFEYADCLDRAAACEDSAEQLVHVAAFTISAYSTTINRTTKPFNPLLGETYECDRTDDLGWKSFAEQVSHHPPLAGVFSEGRDWELYQEVAISSKFRGRYLQIIPQGIAHLVFKKSGNHYTWRKVTTTVHNIIVGKLWVDNHGEMDISNHRNGDKCHLKYSAYSYFSREIPRKVTGVVADKEGNAKWVLTGTWDKRMEAAKVVHIDESNKGKPVFETGAHVCIWEKRPLPPGSDRMYNFTSLAITLNEPEEGVAPTDSRLRPDQRAMEEGRWDDANKLKQELEEKQRAARKKREAEMEEASKRGETIKGYQPIWFEMKTDPVTGSPIHVYKGKYWDCKEKSDWSSCPPIFL
ncbi:oxysterol-binding protein 1-like isoform X2 [Crassostrea angulata]|uniref:oxysterol-binding protein 1-like isoform X2 n=1 Tax=Magallana angulata TaxID=2784310 RepID=UPI00148A8F0B|nr:oxysterol-binding protein 1 isoform X2 [Crassostrea gigas]XP_052713315.1 oxysterol-binding protein 1-like isoform X2 [Crassostrea angulata]